MNSDYCSRKCLFEHEEEKAVQVENARVRARQKQQKEAEEKRAWEALTHEQRSAYNAKIERQNAINRANRIERDAKRKARYEAMTPDELVAQYHEHMDALNEMTGGQGTLAYIRASTAMLAWKELVARGLDSLREEADVEMKAKAKVEQDRYFDSLRRSRFPPL